MTADLPAAVRTSAIEIGASLAGWRKILGLTAEQVADRAGVTRVTLRKVEHGDPSVGFRVARALGTLTEALDPLKTDLGRARADLLVRQRVR